MTVKDRLYCLYLADTGPTKYWSIWVCLFAATGMVLRSETPSQDMLLLLNAMPWWGWALTLSYIALSRVAGILFWTGTVLTRILTPLASIFLWAFFFAAQAVAPNFGLGLLFLIPALQEAWILSRVFYDERLL